MKIIDKLKNTISLLKKLLLWVLKFVHIFIIIVFVILTPVSLLYMYSGRNIVSINGKCADTNGIKKEMKGDLYFIDKAEKNLLEVSKLGEKLSVYQCDHEKVDVNFLLQSPIIRYKSDRKMDYKSYIKYINSSKYHLLSGKCSNVKYKQEPMTLIRIEELPNGVKLKLISNGIIVDCINSDINIDPIKESHYLKKSIELKRLNNIGRVLLSAKECRLNGKDFSSVYRVEGLINKFDNKEIHLSSPTSKGIIICKSNKIQEILPSLDKNTKRK
jgi:hypothetical protein